MKKNDLSTDIYNEMLKLEALKVKHKIITSSDDVPHYLDKAIEELRKGWINSICDEVIDDGKRVSKTNQKHKRKNRQSKNGDSGH